MENFKGNILPLVGEKDSTRYDAPMNPARLKPSPIRGRVYFRFYHLCGIKSLVAQRTLHAILILCHHARQPCGKIVLREQRICGSNSVL